MSLDVEELKQKTELKADLNELDNLQKEMRTKIDDLENRSKRNNIVLWNIPQGSEKGDVFGFLYDFFATHMDLYIAENICIDCAHRSGKKSSDKPRPIHARILEWHHKEIILREAPSVLKEHKYKGTKVIITDDVSKSVREDRGTLRLNHSHHIKAKEDVTVAFIPFTVPARIRYKQGDSWRHFYSTKN